jgi:hypothetical protein
LRRLHRFLRLSCISVQLHMSSSCPRGLGKSQPPLPNQHPFLPTHLTLKPASRQTADRLECILRQKIFLAMKTRCSFSLGEKAGMRAVNKTDSPNPNAFREFEPSPADVQPSVRKEGMKKSLLSATRLVRPWPRPVFKPLFESASARPCQPCPSGADAGHAWRWRKCSRPWSSTS